MEFAKVFWDVMTTIGCIFSLVAVVLGIATLFIMGRDMYHDLLDWKQQKRLGKSQVFFCEKCGEQMVLMSYIGATVDVHHFDRALTAEEIRELADA